MAVDSVGLAVEMQTRDISTTALVLLEYNRVQVFSVVSAGGAALQVPLCGLFLCLLALVCNAYLANYILSSPPPPSFLPLTLLPLLLYAIFIAVSSWNMKRSIYLWYIYSMYIYISYVGKVTVVLSYI